MKSFSIRAGYLSQDFKITDYFICIVNEKGISLPLKNQQNFKGNMRKQGASNDSDTLRKRIENLPEDSVLFRSDFPEYHCEFVGSTLAEMVKAGALHKVSQGIYVKPRVSRFGLVLPSVDKIVQAIAIRDNAQVLPSGDTALNALGLSTQVPVNYTYLTTGSERAITLDSCKIMLKRGVPKNFCYRTRLAALLVQALKTLGQNNVGEEELQTIRDLTSKETGKSVFAQDVAQMPIWMRRILKPIISK